MGQKKTKRECLLLCRVSTGSQDYEPQIRELKEHATKLYGFKEEDITTLGTVESGYKDINNKEGFNKVKEHISSHPNCCAVFTVEISRLGRRQSVIHQVKDWFIANEIQLYGLHPQFKLFEEDVDHEIRRDYFGKPLLDASATYTFAIFGQLAENEFAFKKARFARAKKNLQAKGLSHTGKVLFGYKKVKDEASKKNTLEIDKDLQAQIIDMMETYINGIDGKNIGITELTRYAIAKGYHQYLTSKRNVNKLLKEKAYTGEKTTNNKRKKMNVENGKTEYVVTNTYIQYPQLISESLFEKVQAQLLCKNTNVDRGEKHVTILSKLIKCNCCGRYLGGSYRIRDGHAANTYRCTQRNTVVNCENANRSYSMPLLDTIVWEFVKNNSSHLILAAQETEQNVNVDDLKNEINNLLNRIEQLNEKKKRAGVVYVELGDKDRFDKTIKEINKNIRIITNDVNEKKEQIKQIEISRNRSSEIVQLIERYEKDKSQIRRIIREFVKDIVVLYNDVKYMVVEIKGQLYYTTNAGEEDKCNGIYYAFIDKHDNHRIRFGYFKKLKDLYFDENKFIVSARELSLDEMAINFDNDNDFINHLKAKGISLPMGYLAFVEKENLKKLDVYNKD